MIEKVQQRLLSKPESARYLGISQTTFQRLVQSHEIPRPVKIRHAARWDREDLDRFIADVKSKLSVRS